MATQTETQRKAAARKAARTRRRNAAKRSQAARRSAETRAQAELGTLGVVQAQAERALLIPVGAWLTARDTVIDAARPYYQGRESAERELTKLQREVRSNLRRYERRGATARNPLISRAVFQFVRDMLLLEYPDGATDADRAEQLRFAEG